jgi:hypothetical protein
MPKGGIFSDRDFKILPYMPILVLKAKRFTNSGNRGSEGREPEKNFWK